MYKIKRVELVKRNAGILQCHC